MARCRGGSYGSGFGGGGSVRGEGPLPLMVPLASLSSRA